MMTQVEIDTCPLSTIHISRGMVKPMASRLTIFAKSSLSKLRISTHSSAVARLRYKVCVQDLLISKPSVSGQ